MLEPIEETQEGLTVTVCVANDQGLHARPAARLAQEAQKFGAEIFLAMDGMEVDAKSILDILSLAAAKGTCLTLRGVGADARHALEHLSALFRNRFREE
ncbi:HPr family phosphocarrier protein [Nitratidesulfovibrio sp. HK-II]|uniref:HPr family phosphocarrier protein n=1 Tax=Nitratidesulfovibrio sp. HK-II TaxID=2009266 RepID=UPI000E2FD9DB|nr:HPr family phosphocarrier protein [Nitratidesulfovibrio sp. HK-II]GBO96714.1 nitrogen regulation associated [Nitratidesulfovibrio sp. HK-II]